MKRVLLMILACTALTFACKPDTPVDPGTDPGKDPGTEDPGEKPGPEEPTVEYYNSITATLGGATMKSKWEDGDEIQVYNVTQDGNDVEAKYVLKSGAGSATGTFEPAAGVTALEKGGKGYFAAYPYDEDMTFAQHNTFATSISSERTDAAAPMFAYAEDAASLSFSSFMGAVKFTLSGKGNIGSLTLDDANTNNIMSGNVTINPKSGKVTFKNGSSSKHSISYKFASKLELDNSTSPEIVIEVPAGCLADGGSMTLIDMNNAPLAAIAIPGKTVEAGKVAELGKLEFEGQSQTIDLSAAGTANCYIIPDIGNYKFKAVKGNGKEAVAAATVEVLWETYNEPDGEVAPGSLVGSVALVDGYVEISIAEPFHPDNALLAAKDGDGNILWSWHLWIPETPVEAVSDPEKVFWATDVLDRNLGALIVQPETTGDVATYAAYGLFFQWGRKDPMTGPYGIAGTGMGEEMPATYSVDETIANPTTLATGTDNNSDWNTTHQVDMWDAGDGAKTIYDPCPPGYKVPVYNTDYKLWIKRADDDWTFDESRHWFKYNDTGITFPACGYLSNSTSLTKEAIRGLVWSATPGLGDEQEPRGSAAFFDLSRDSGKYYYHSYFKYAAGSIRCAVEH